MNKRTVTLLTNAELDMLERIIKELEEIARVSKMETSQFPDEVKQVTKVWRESWITHPLENNIDDLQRLSNKLKRIRVKSMDE